MKGIFLLFCCAASLHLEVKKSYAEVLIDTFQRKQPTTVTPNSEAEDWAPTANSDWERIGSGKAEL